MTTVTPAKLTAMHFYAWKAGLKTGMYYLRSQAAADAIKFTLDQKPVATDTKSEQQDRKDFQSPVPKPSPSPDLPLLDLKAQDMKFSSPAPSPDLPLLDLKAQEMKFSSPAPSPLVTEENKHVVKTEEKRHVVVTEEKKDVVVVVPEAVRQRARQSMGVQCTRENRDCDSCGS